MPSWSDPVVNASQVLSANAAVQIEQYEAGNLMKSLLKVILWCVLIAVAAPEARAQVQAGAKTMRKVEQIFDQDGPVYQDSQTRAAPAGIKPVSPTANSSTPAKWAVPGAKSVDYSKLELRIISGPPNKRIATINNQSFIAGETFKVTVGTNRVNVTCQEIRERSVTVKVAGEAQPRELKLAAWR